MKPSRWIVTLYGNPFPAIINVDPIMREPALPMTLPQKVRDKNAEHAKALRIAFFHFPETVSHHVDVIPDRRVIGPQMQLFEREET